MTGVLGRLRAWVGSLFGGNGSDDASEESGEAAEAGGGPVVHRDDRPLETPSGMSKADLSPNAVSSTTEARERRATASTPTTSEGATGAGVGPETSGDEEIRIPDAEGGVAEPRDDADPVGSDPEPTDSDEAVPGGGAASPPDSTEASRPESSGADGGGTTAVDRTADSTPNDDAPAFKCSVCGTGVDDADATCPLCRSTEVVPADGSGTGATTTGRGRTETTAADDDAVDALANLERDDTE